MKPIKNLLFDLAGVLLNLDIIEDTRALRAIGLPDFEQCLRRPEISYPVTQYVNGLMNERDLCSSIRPYCRPGISDEEMLLAMDAVLADLPKSRLELLVELRKRYKVYLLSNIYEKAWNYTLAEIMKNNYRVEDCFDQTFLSYELQLAKPDTKIFETVIRETGLLPQETLYLDDTSENIEAGKKLGFQSVKVPMNQLESILEQLSL